MVPHTSDGRVMFAIPWHGHTLVGTTDTPIDDAPLEPVAVRAGDRVHPRDRRPLPRQAAVAAPTSSASSPASAPWCAPARRPATPPRSRATTPSASTPSGILTITGGKWTTYRHMAEDCVNQAASSRACPKSAVPYPGAQHPRLPSRFRPIRPPRRVRVRRAAGPGLDAPIRARRRSIPPCRTRQRK